MKLHPCHNTHHHNQTDHRHHTPTRATPDPHPFCLQDPRLYEDLGSYEDIRRTFDDILELYNGESAKKLMLVLFEMALEHITRIMRIVRMPRGNALLIGVGGSGKQSNVRLASYCAGYQVGPLSLPYSRATHFTTVSSDKAHRVLCSSRFSTKSLTSGLIPLSPARQVFTIQLARGYNEALFREDLKVCS